MQITHSYFILHKNIVYGEHAWFVKTATPEVKNEDCIEGNLRCLHFYAYSLLLNNFKTSAKINTPYEDGIVAKHDLRKVIANLHKSSLRLNKCTSQEDYTAYCTEIGLPEIIIEKLILPYIKYWKFIVHQLQNGILELEDFFKTAEKENKNISILGI